METDTFEFIPNPKAIGIDNELFTRPVDAVAEIVDNAIQSYSKFTAHSRVIKIQIYTSQHDTGFLTVSDTGCGMSRSEVISFATFAKSREDRKLQPTLNDTMSLSKFGVGGKQAGFSLGDNIGIYTKKLDDQWKEFHLDAEEMKRKYDRGENPYVGECQYPTIDNIEEYLTSGELNFPELVQDVQRHMASSQSGTIFVCRLKSEKANRLRRNVSEFEMNLAEIYFFHLYPQHQHGISSSTSSASAAESDSIINIEVQFYHRGVASRGSTNLRDVKSFSYECFHNEHVKKTKFDMTIPAHIFPSEKKCSITVHGVVLYFPCTPDGETLKHRRGSVAVPSVQVCWQYRLLPEREYSDLPFFPLGGGYMPALTPSTRWKQRTVAYLFVDWNFPFVSNNKLRVNQENFDSILRAKSSELSYRPTSFPNEFLRWLCQCGKEDVEYCFSDRKVDHDTNSSVFMSLILSGSEVKISCNDYVKVIYSATRTDLGQIQSFVVDESLPAHIQEYMGQGVIRYHRLPKGLYGDSQREEVKVSLVTFKQIPSVNLQLEEQSEMHCHAPNKLELYQLSPTGVAKAFGTQPIFAGVQQTFLVNILHDQRPCFKAPNQQQPFHLELDFSVLGKDSIYNGSTELTEFTTSTGGKRIKCSVISAIVFPFPGQQTVEFDVYTHDFQLNSYKYKILGKKATLTILENSATQWSFRNQSIFCRLGEPVPPLVIDLKDDNNNIVAASSKEGSVKLEIQCVGERTIQLTGPSNLVSLVPTSNELGLRTPPSTKWKIEPIPGQDVFPAQAVQSKDLQFKCILHVDAVGGTRARQMEGTIVLKLYPGTPTSLHLEHYPREDEPAKLDLKFNDQIPPIKLWCVDCFHNRTMPLPSEMDKWRVVLSGEDDPLQFENHLKARSAFINEFGEILLHSLVSPFGAGASTRKTSKTLIGLQLDGKSLPNFQPRTLIVNFMPDEYPERIELFDGTHLLCNGSTMIAGSYFYDLNVRLVSNKGNVVDFPRSGKIACHVGNKKRKLPEISSDGSIKEFRAPTRMGEDMICVEVSDSSLEKSLTIAIEIIVTPGDPKFWKIIVDPSLQRDDGIFYDAANDLRAKIRGVTLIDINENPVDILCNVPKTNPVLSITSIVPDQPLQHKLPLIPNRAVLHATAAATEEEADRDVIHYMLSAAASIQPLFLPQDCPIKIGLLHDKYEVLNDAIVTNIIGLRPTRLRLTSKTFDIIEHGDHFITHLEFQEQICDLEIELLDDNGHLCGAFWTKKMSMKISAIGNNYEKNNLNQNPIRCDMSIDANMKRGSDWCLIVDVCCQHNTQPAINLSSQLDIEVVKLNNVTKLQLYFDGAEDAMEVDGEQELERRVEAGELIPALIIRAITADGSAYSPTRDSFVFKITKDQKKVLPVQPLLHKLEDRGGLDAICLAPLKAVGEYTLRVNYDEKREQLRGKLSIEFQSLACEVSIVVYPSEARLIQLSKTSVISKRVLQTSNEVDRSFGKNIKFVVLDGYGNELPDLSGLQLTCTIVSSSSSQGLSSFLAAAQVLPTLQSANNQGVVSAGVSMNCFVFPSLVITDGAEEAPVSDGEYILQFCLAKSINPLVHVNRLPETFIFRSRLTMSNEHARIAEEAESARIALEKHATNIAEIKNLVNLLNVMGNAAESNREFQAAIRAIVQDRPPRNSGRLDSLLAKLIERKKEMESRRQRPAIISGSLRPCPEDALGYLVNLATVEDVTVAKIISWAMQSEMDAIVVNDHATAMNMFHHSKVWAVESAFPFQPGSGGVRARGRGLSSSDASDDFLPLPDLGCGEDAHYLVNLIEPAHAGHRGTIFWQGLKDAVLVKDMKVAQAVRQRFYQDYKRQPPLIFTRDGHRWNKSGVLNGSNRLPAHLAFVFGEKEPTSTPVYRDVIKLLEDCEKVCAHLSRLLELEGETQGTNVDELNRKISQARSLNLGA